MTKSKRAVLALADGSIYEGLAFGDSCSVDKAVVGEVVFNTSMYGYQEILTDPSYAGQIMSFTSPHIGNVGCNPQDEESSDVHVQGLIVRSPSKVMSNFRGKETLDAYLKRNKKVAIGNIDTRELVKHLRDNGSQMGAIATGDKIDTSSLVDKAKAEGSMLGKSYVKQVSSKKSYQWKELTWKLQNGGHFPQLSEAELESRPHVVALDCGVKRNILRLLTASGFKVTVVPAYSSKEEILKLNPDGLFISNGPGDPATLNEIVSVVKELLGQIPMFGICLGHQILAQALDAKTYKLDFGHRGGNHPVIDCETKKVEITVQNHGFAVDEKSINKDVKISHINLNDQTVEGIEVPELKVFGIQYHPEASPGPHDAQYLFDRFYNLVNKG